MIGFYERAKFLVERYGLSIIPTRYGDKTPIPHGWTKFCDELPTIKQLFVWDKAHDKMNISIALGKASRLIALDVDVVDPFVHQELIPYKDRIVIRHGGTGRYAYLYRYNGEENRTVRGLQLLSHGKQLVIEGLHPSGNEYKLVVHEDMDIGEALASVPFLPSDAFDTIADYIEKNVTEETENNSKARMTENVGRNNALVKEAYYWACYSVQSNLKAEDIAEKLLAMPEASWFSDPSEHRPSSRDAKANALKMATRMLKKAEENDDIYPDFDNYFCNVEVPKVENIEHKDINLEHIVQTLDHRSEEYKKSMIELNEKNRLEMNKAFVPPPIPESGLIRDIYEYGKHFYTEVPVISLAAGFGVMSQLTNMNFCSDQVNGTCMILSLAASGVGKSFAHQLINNLFRGDSNKVTSRPVSGQELYAKLCETRDLRYVIDEIDALISNASVKKNNTPHGAELANALNNLWCSSWEESQPFETAGSIEARKRAKAAGKEEPEIIYFPMVSLFGSTTIENFEAVADRKVVTGGFLNRFLVFQQKYYNERKLTVADDALAKDKYMKIRDKVEYLKTLKAVENPLDMFIQKLVPINIRLWDLQECRELVAQHNVKFVSSVEGRSGLANRYFQHVLKIALLYSISEIEHLELTDVKDGPIKYRYATNHQIAKHHVEYGIKLFHWMLDEVKELYDNVADNDSSSNKSFNEQRVADDIKLMNQVIKYLNKHYDWVNLSRVKSDCRINKGDILKDKYFFNQLKEYCPLIEIEIRKPKTKEIEMIRIRREE